MSRQPASKGHAASSAESPAAPKSKSANAKAAGSTRRTASARTRTAGTTSPETKTARTKATAGSDRGERAVTFPAGFRAWGVQAHVKYANREDLALIASDAPCAAAGVFTKNRVPGEPVKWSRRVARLGRARAIVANSGGSNVATGEQGARDARRMAEAAAEVLGLRANEVFVASTGVIGAYLPMDRIENGIAEAGRRIRDAAATTAQGDALAARAIMTTDTVRKMVTRTVRLGGKTVRLGAIAKGSGMIHPDMATMLCFITTDAAIEAPVLRRALREAVEPTLNMLSVDGETSTSDMALILANGRAGNPPLTAAGTRKGGRLAADYGAFRDALAGLLAEMTRKLAADGEGATHYVEIRVRGASSPRAARTIARNLSVSALVKTALFGADPNPGRILQTIGRSGVPLKPERIDVSVGGVPMVAAGTVNWSLEKKASQAMRQKDIVLDIDLHLGNGEATAYTCDYSYDYIRINAEYTT